MPIAKKLLFIFLFSLGLSVTLASAAEKQSAKPATPEISLMFFLNPNGAPCQTQEKIINQFRPQIEKLAKIVPVSTESFSAQMLFRKYGIRYLPALVLVDAQQQEIKRFSPGIQPGELIVKELSSTKVASVK